MITGKEGVHAYGTDNYDVKGITLKQHMVIEFTKALMSNPEVTNLNTLGSDHWKAAIGDSTSIANEVIKQLNEDEKETNL